MSRLVESGLITVIFFLAINVLFLNIFLFSKKENSLIKAASTNNIQTNPTCDTECEDSIVTKIISIMPTRSIPETIPTKADLYVKETIIPVGNGSVHSSDWSELQSTDLTIDTSFYPNIKKVYFETFLSIPNAQGYGSVKLYNVTDKHDVWFSESTMEADKIIHTEKEIHLDSGKKTYRVMMKSTLGVDLLLHNSRIRILN